MIFNTLRSRIGGLLKGQKVKPNNNLVDVPVLSQAQHIVLYVGCEGDERISSFLTRKSKEIAALLSQNGYSFIFYPSLVVEGETETWGSLSSLLTYKFPSLYGMEHELKEHLTSISPLEFYERICLAYGLENKNTPLLLVLNESTPTNGASLMTYPIGSDQSPEKVLNELFFEIINKTKKSSIPDISYYDPQGDKDLKATSVKYNAEDYFDEEASRISKEVASHINFLINKGHNKALYSIYNTLLTQTKVLKPELYEIFSSSGKPEIEKRLSRLVVDSHYRIFLPDYNNLEIELTPLPKTLYLFYLNHPEGVMLHDLVDHRQELLAIYSRITNSSCNSEIKKRIYDMTDMSKNSINEKCSRIKEAFVSKMDDSIAKYYYISGERGAMKKILLNYSLIHLIQ